MVPKPLSASPSRNGLADGFRYALNPRLARKIRSRLREAEVSKCCVPTIPLSEPAMLAVELSQTSSAHGHTGEMATVSP